MINYKQWKRIRQLLIVIQKLLQMIFLYHLIQAQRKILYCTILKNNFFGEHFILFIYSNILLQKSKTVQRPN